ncbi:MAG: threonine ammonia-lyase, partial [Blastomonas fulva]
MTSPTAQLTLETIRAAHQRIAGSIVRTPTLVSRTLSAITGATVYLKFENLQFTAAYKERGALNFLSQMTEEAKAKG